MLKPTLITGLTFIGAYLLGSSHHYSPLRSPAEYPIDYRVVSPQSATVVTMTSERRSIIIVPNALSGANADLRICPEPPADAADNVASLLSGSAAGSAATPVGENKGELAMSASSSAALAAIFERSQGVELFRDGSNALCLAWLNDVYNAQDIDAWRSDFRLLLRTSSALISQEIVSDQLTRQPNSMPPPMPALPLPDEEPLTPRDKLESLNPQPLPSPLLPAVPALPSTPAVPNKLEK